MPLLAALQEAFAIQGDDPLERLTHPDGRLALPVFSFGDPTKALVATISLNPSDQEFFGSGALPEANVRFAEPWLVSLVL
jgi:hypothetical protein